MRISTSLDQTGPRETEQSFQQQETHQKKGSRIYALAANGSAPKSLGAYSRIGRQARIMLKEGPECWLKSSQRNAGSLRFGGTKV